MTPMNARQAVQLSDKSIAYGADDILGVNMHSVANIR